jgi:hypothetical protein
VEERLEALLAERGRAEEELADAAGAREQALQGLYRLRSAAERLELRRESAGAGLQRLRDELERPRRVLDGRVRAQREALTEQIRLLEDRLRALDRTLAEREDCRRPPRAGRGGRADRALTARGRAGQRASRRCGAGQTCLRRRRDDAAGAFELLERARDAGLGSLVVLVGRDPARLVAEMPVVAKRSCSRPRLPR